MSDRARSGSRAGGVRQASRHALAQRKSCLSQRWRVRCVCSRICTCTRVRLCIVSEDRHVWCMRMVSTSSGRPGGRDGFVPVGTRVPVPVPVRWLVRHDILTHHRATTNQRNPTLNQCPGQGNRTEGCIGACIGGIRITLTASSQARACSNQLVTIALSVRLHAPRRYLQLFVSLILIPESHHLPARSCSASNSATAAAPRFSAAVLQPPRAALLVRSHPLGLEEAAAHAQ